MSLIIDNDFITKYEGIIKSSVRKMGFKGDDFDEVYSKVIERLLTHNNYDKEKGAVSTWLHLVIGSVGSNYRVGKERSKDALDQAGNVDIESIKSHIGREDAGYAQDEVTRIMQRLPISLRDRLIFLAVNVSQLSHREAGELFELSESAVSKVCSRVMKVARESITNQ